MNRAQKIIQAYRNTPWRRQTQMLSRLAAVGVVATIVMIVYTWMTSQAGAYGLQVQSYQKTALAAERDIENMRVELAGLTSNQALAARVTQMGYVPIDPNRVRYMEVEGYYAEPALQLAPSVNSVHQQAREDFGLPTEFTTSLFSWIQDAIYKLSIYAWGGD